MTLRICALLICVLITTIVCAQLPEPVHFEYKVTKMSKLPSPPGEGSGVRYELTITATIAEGWHLYSQTQPATAIAEPTKIVFTKNPLLVITGTPNELGKKETYTDKAAGITQYQYGHTVDFVQALTAKGKVKCVLNGSITYQTCTDERCLPPKTVSFSVTIP